MRERQEKFDKQQTLAEKHIRELSLKLKI